MENKFSSLVKNEVDSVLKGFDLWKNLFFINHEFFLDGWAIFLKEKLSYPRKIVIFKSYEKNTYSIKSFEIRHNNEIEERNCELYFKENIESQEELLKEVKQIIYGKDLLQKASQTYYKNF